MHGLRCLWKPHEGARSPGAGVTVSLLGCWKLNLGSLGEQYTLLLLSCLSAVCLLIEGPYRVQRTSLGSQVSSSILLAQGLNSGSVAKCLYLPVILRQRFIKFPRLALNLLLESRLTLNFQSSCFSLPSSWGVRLAHRAPLGCS